MLKGRVLIHFYFRELFAPTPAPLAPMARVVAASVNVTTEPVVTMSQESVTVPLDTLETW